MSTNIFSGARAIFSINGKKVAWASGCNGSEEVMYEPAEVMDNIEVAEHVPVGYRVTFSCEIFRTIKGTPGASAPANSTGSLKDQGIFPKIDGPRGTNILLTAPMQVTIHDRLTQQQVFRLEEVKAASHNFNVTARGIVGQNVTFVAIRAYDESGG